MKELNELYKTKEILIILDGLSEEKIPSLNNMTPLEYAHTPYINKIIEKGTYDRGIFYPQDKIPDSLNCILTILGVPSGLIPRNRAYLEALASDINIERDEIVMRCNLISIKDNKLSSFNGGLLTNHDMKEASLNVMTSDDIDFYHISNYRNLVVFKKMREIMELKDIPPHENVGKSMDVMLRSIKKINKLYKFILDNKFVNDNIEYMFYPWGVSEVVEVPTFNNLHNKTCSLICNAEIVKGIGKAMDMNIVSLKNVTGDVDTDLREKSLAVLNETERNDVVICHINGTDEVSHRKDYFGKVRFIEKIDRELISPIYKNISKDTKIIILSDHQTSSITGKHERGTVDIITSNGM